MASILRCSRSYHRLVLRIVLAVALVAAILFFSSTWPPAVNAEGPQLPWRDVQDSQEVLTTSEASKQPVVAQESTLPQLKDDTKSPEQPTVAQEPTLPQQKDDTKLSDLPESRDQVLAISEHDWDAAADRIEALLGDEYRLKALLAPITETGEPLLRDLTHRVRAYGSILKTWEDLHLSVSNDGLREIPVIPRLRAMARSSQSIADAIRNYDKLRHFVNTFARRLFPWTMLSHPDHMSLHASFYTGGRGIVFTAGNRQGGELLTVIPSLRQLGCELPIEVMYLGDEDLDEELRDELEKLDGVVTRDLRLMVEDDGWHLAGWAAKPFAILMSSFREVVFIDADSFFFVNPADLFEDEDYRKKGALFFKDRNVSPESKRTWIKSILPPPISTNVKHNRMWTGESGHQQESGVIVVDKHRHFVSLLLTTRLNGPDRDSDESKGTKGVYDMMYGDKETFWLSFEMAGDLDYVFHPGVAGTMGKITSEHPADPDRPDEAPKAADGPMICSPQLIHFDRSGKPIWFNGWIAVNKDDLHEWQEFDVYLEEKPEEGRKPKKDAWQIHAANVVCLEGVEAKEFSAREKSTLDGILKLAKENALIER